ALIFGIIEMALRGSNESICSHLPTFEAPDADAIPRASRSSVGAAQCPVVLSTVTSDTQLVHDHTQIRECGHERLSYFRDCTSSHRRRASVDGKGGSGRIKLSHTGGIFAAPGGGIAHREILQFGWISSHQVYPYPASFPTTKAAFSRWFGTPEAGVKAPVS